jgi:TonB family protein
MNFSFGGPGAYTPRRYGPPVRGGRAPIDFSLGPMNRGPGEAKAFARFLGGDPGPDWRNALRAWLDRHAYYPPQAAAAGEDGTTVVRVVASRDGRVQSVTMLSSSGSQWLDLATTGMFRDATVPPFPPDSTDPTFTFELRMSYILLRQ